MLNLASVRRAVFGRAVGKPVVRVVPQVNQAEEWAAAGDLLWTGLFADDFARWTPPPGVSVEAVRFAPVVAADFADAPIDLELAEPPVSRPNTVLPARTDIRTAGPGEEPAPVNYWVRPSIPASTEPVRVPAADTPTFSRPPAAAAPAEVPAVGSMAPAPVSFGPQGQGEVAHPTTSPAVFTSPGVGDVASEAAAEVRPGADARTDDPAPNQAPDKSDPAAVKPTHSYPLEDQAPVGMTVHPTRFAVGVVDPADRDRPQADGLSFVRPITDAVAVWDGQPDAVKDQPGVAFVAPVFVATETGTELVLLDEVIVALRPGEKAEDVFGGDPRVAQYRPLSGTPDQFVVTTTVGVGEPTLAAANEWAADPRVRAVTPNFYQNIQKYYTPNDPRFGNQWHLHNTGQGGGLIDADSDLLEAWDVNPGGSSSIVIGVQDDGVPLDHPDLFVFTNPGEVPGDGIDNDGNGYIDDTNGWNFVEGNNKAFPQATSDAHGTAVAGVAAARGDNGIGVTGAAYKSQVISGRVFGATTASTAGFTESIYYLAGRSKDGLSTWRAADVVNHSWGGGAATQAMADAFTWATTAGRQGKGAINLVASGNGGGATVSYPSSLSATIPGVVSVGATNNKGVRSGYSQYGTAIDWVTPSDNFTPATHLAIDTTDRIGAAGYSPDDYTGTGSAGFGGTSSATPLSAGIAALTLAQADKLGVSITPAQMRAYLRNATDLIGPVSYDMATGRHVEYGTGRLNAFAAVSGIGKPEISVLGPTAELFSGTGKLDFGTLLTSQTKDVTLRVRNQGTQPLSLGSLTASGTGFSIASGLGKTTLGLGEATTFTARFAPTAAGTFTGGVSIASNDADEAIFAINLAGIAQATSIAGTAFEDWNGNGAADPIDRPIGGQFVYLDTNGNGQWDGPAVNTLTASPNAAIADNTSFKVSQTLSGAPAGITDVNVKLNITHTYVGDLILTLHAPDGTQVLLTNRTGGGGDNFTNTVFDQQAGVAITAGAAPFTGSFRPVGDLNTLNGRNPNGVWQLEVADKAGGDTGTLLNWSLVIGSGTQEPNTTTDATGFYAFPGLANGTYPIRTTALPAGWTYTSPGAVSGYTVTITGPNDEFLNRNYGQAKTNRFYGFAWEDENANAVRDAGEPAATSRTIFVDQNGNGQLDGGTGSFTNSTPLPLPDVTTTTSTLTVGGLDGNLADVNVRVNMTHTYVGDLVVTLIAPDGTRVGLTNRTGGSGQNFTNTVFDQQAAVAITAGAAPFTGTFRPTGDLNTLNGRPAAGEWKLEVADLAGGDSGTLNSWGVDLAIVGEPFAVPEASGRFVIDLPPGPADVGIALPVGFRTSTPASGKHSVTAAGAPLFQRDFGVVEAIPPTVVVTAAGGTVQRSRVSGMVATFSERVILPADPTAAFTLTRGGTPVPLTVAVNDAGPATVVTITPTAGMTHGSMDEGVYLLTVRADQVRDRAFNFMAADATVTMHRLFGDMTGDRTVNAADQTIFRAALGSRAGTSRYNNAADFDNDGDVDAADNSQFRLRFGTTI